MCFRITAEQVREGWRRVVEDPWPYATTNKKMVNGRPPQTVEARQIAAEWRIKRPAPPPLPTRLTCESIAVGINRKLAAIQLAMEARCVAAPSDQESEAANRPTQPLVPDPYELMIAWAGGWAGDSPTTFNQSLFLSSPRARYDAMRSRPHFARGDDAFVKFAWIRLLDMVYGQVSRAHAWIDALPVEGLDFTDGGTTTATQWKDEAGWTCARQLAEGSCDCNDSRRAHKKETDEVKRVRRDEFFPPAQPRSAPGSSADRSGATHAGPAPQNDEEEEDAGLCAKAHRLAEWNPFERPLRRFVDDAVAGRPDKQDMPGEAGATYRFGPNNVSRSMFACRLFALGVRFGNTLYYICPFDEHPVGDKGPKSRYCAINRCASCCKTFPAGMAYLVNRERFVVIQPRGPYTLDAMYRCRNCDPEESIRDGAPRSKHAKHFHHLIGAPKSCPKCSVKRSQDLSSIYVRTGFSTVDIDEAAEAPGRTSARRQISDIAADEVQSIGGSLAKLKLWDADRHDALFRQIMQASPDERLDILNDALRDLPKRRANSRRAG